MCMYNCSGVGKYLISYSCLSRVHDSESNFHPSSTLSTISCIICICTKGGERVVSEKIKKCVHVVPASCTPRFNTWNIPHSQSVARRIQSRQSTMANMQTSLKNIRASPRQNRLSSNSTARPSAAASASWGTLAGLQKEQSISQHHRGDDRVCIFQALFA